MISQLFGLVGSDGETHGYQDSHISLTPIFRFHPLALNDDQRRPQSRCRPFPFPAFREAFFGE